MMKVIRTNSEHLDFRALVGELNDYLSDIDGDEHAFYDQFNNIDVLHHVVVGYLNDDPVGCGAMKRFDSDSMEVKRMYTKPGFRTLGVATEILIALENWAMELGFKSCILETGKRQVEAVDFYKKKNYRIITNYDPYLGIDNSICFKKELRGYEKRQ